MDGKLQKLFDLPEDVQILEDHPCALVQGIPRQGHLWVTADRVCFYSKVGSKKIVISVQFKDITTLTKQSTAQVAGNAIELATRDGRYFFTSFSNRDHLFSVLEQLRQPFLAPSPREPVVPQEDSAKQTEDAPLPSLATLATAVPDSRLHDSVPGSLDSSMILGSSDFSSDASSIRSSMLSELGSGDFSTSRRGWSVEEAPEKRSEAEVAPMTQSMVSAVVDAVNDSSLPPVETGFPRPSTGLSPGSLTDSTFFQSSLLGLTADESEDKPGDEKPKENEQRPVESKHQTVASDVEPDVAKPSEEKVEETVEKEVEEPVDIVPHPAHPDGKVAEDEQVQMAAQSRDGEEVMREEGFTIEDSAGVEEQTNAKDGSSGGVKVVEKDAVRTPPALDTPSVETGLRNRTAKSATTEPVSSAAAPTSPRATQSNTTVTWQYLTVPVVAAGMLVALLYFR